MFICGSLAFAQSPSFNPPGETFTNKNQLEPLKQAIAQKQYADAATRIDALIHESADQLMAIDGGSLVSVRLWIDSLPAATRQALMPEYDKLVGEAAKAAVEQAMLRPNRRPEDLLAAGADYPLSSANRDAIGQAAMRALDLGDTSSATVLADRARELGWKPSAAQQQALDAIKPATAAAVSLAVATPWYANDPPVPAKRVIPVLANNVIFISTERTVMAAKTSGELLWKYESPKAEPVMTAAKLGFQRPTVFCDLAGVPQVVIVRHVLPGTRFGCVRALRASDGKLLWSSDSSPALSGWSLATTPTIGGRCVWVLAVDETQRPAPLMLMSVEIMTGRLVTQTQLGTYPNAPDSGDGGADMEKLWNSAGVLVDGADVFVSPGSGLVTRVDRFDGKIRWVRVYPSVPTPGEQIRELARKALSDHKSRVALKQLLEELRRLSGDVPPGKPPKPEKGEKGEKGIQLPDDAAELADRYSQQARWMTTPAVVGSVLVVAPGDSQGVFGLDRGNGAQFWDNAELAKQSLVGVAGNVTVFAGEGLTGIDVRTGKSKWTWTDSPLEGPAAVSGNVVRAWAGGRLVVLSAETGTIDALTSAGTTIGPVLKNEQSKAALTGAEAISTLLAPAKPTDPKKK